MEAFPKGSHPLDLELNRTVIDLAQAEGLNLYLVGGYVRDAILSRYRPAAEARDLDYAVAGGEAAGFARTVAAKTDGHFVLLDKKCDTARVVLKDGTMLDFAGCVGGGIDTDIQRRDFTVNALAWSPLDPDGILDLVGGLRDIKEGVVRVVAQENLSDDPLRVLRAYRFAATLGFKIEPETDQMLKVHARELGNVASERISYELFLTMEADAVFPFIEDMGKNGVLEVIFPELEATRQVTPNAFHHLGLFDHSLELVRQAEDNLSRLPEWARRSFKTELASGVSRLAATKVACLLHDIGKPGTWEVRDDGRHTFYGHDKLGAEMCQEIGERLKWSKPLERFITKLVRWHLRPGQLFHQGEPTTRAVHRFYRVIADDLPELMLLSFADLGATCGQGLDEEKRESLSRCFFELLDNYPVFKNKELTRQRLLDGQQVMELLDIEEGPIVGDLLMALMEAQGLNEVSNRRQAEDFVRRLYAKKCSK